MAEIVFTERRVEGHPDNEAVFVIPDSGPLLQIPFEWDGAQVRPGIFDSLTWRRSAVSRHYPAVHTSQATLIWVQERQEWVAFATEWETDDPSAATWYHDQYVTLHGPWNL